MAQGNGTEVGLINFLMDNEINVADMMKKKNGLIEASIPFDAIQKKSIVAVRHPDLEDTVRVYVKGAPENVVRLCEKTFDISGRRVSLEDY
jgi:magnesium-transporting ATPase (P-type)